MKYQELQNKSEEELRGMLNELRIKLGEMKFQVASNALKNTNEIKQAKKNIARILTVLSGNK
ncbi:MAG: 50S ribosomal protein L29 [Candidatus Yanofskybacteria bacterium CG10_big_fil_rev_8_21_14_0_10_36_16]|uniref:Large ribosomal subunit protein uL29 n=1 Tax=Candidatus Yanofskybacteria bacterium CG10_big_fil_rev_8_21_14_0_10_36_16 TaxID=1975096 RepID=A0A2J0Q869_9BACT|nr:MAG: 50S ribosomal protein L29 [Candidatus Yanofskybacteria bacterium CG10_big_fil_rev_8_21_14_0_10_36_16]